MRGLFWMVGSEGDAEKIDAEFHPGFSCNRPSESIAQLSGDGALRLLCPLGDCMTNASLGWFDLRLVYFPDGWRTCCLHFASTLIAPKLPGATIFQLVRLFSDKN